MKTPSAKNLSRTSSTRNSTRLWSRGSFGASALLATAMLLLSFANCANASQPTQLREWNARWAVLSATFGETLGATNEAQTRVQGEQLWHWMQSRVASQSSQNLSPLQVARWLHEWQVQGGVQTPKVHATNNTSSTRCSYQPAAYVLASQLPQFPQPQAAPRNFAARVFVASLPSHHAAKLSGVRSNHRDE